MKTTQPLRRQNAPRRAFRYIMGIIVIGTLALAITLLEQKHTSLPEKIEGEPPPTTRSVEQLHSFFDAEVKPIIADQLVAGKCPYEELNVRFRQLNEYAVTNTGKNIAVNLRTNYYPASTLVGAAHGYEGTNHYRIIDLYVPAIDDFFDILKNSNVPKWHEAFQSYVLILFMHEMEHTTSTNLNPTHIDVNEESRAWWATCEYDIAPLIEKYHVALDSGDGNLYTAWRLSHGDPANIYWITAIHGRYRDLDGWKQP